MSYSDKALRVATSLAQIRINHTLFKQTLDGVGRIVQLGNRLREPVGMSIIAPAGAGKSLLIDCVQKNVCGWSFLRPDSVLVASLKEAPTVAQIQEDLLANFNYVIPPRARPRTNAALFNVLIDAIEQHAISLIALDEYQHVFLSRKDEARVSINDWVKRVMTRTRVPILLSGTEMLQNIEKADAQLSTRISSVFRLPAFENNEEWKGILTAFAGASQDIDLSSLATKYATLMFKATLGNFRLLKALIIEASMIAVDANEPAVEKEHLRIGFQRVVGPDSSIVNPFA